jgi:hypothetical protein
VEKSSDSQLICAQFSGQYRVKDHALQELFSEVLALILNKRLNVERGILHQVIDDVKTPESQRSMYMDRDMLEMLKRWKQTTQFSAPDDWIFASPVRIGRLPFSYPGVWRALRRGASKLASVTSVPTRSATLIGHGSMLLALRSACSSA